MKLRLDMAGAGMALLLASSCGKDIELGRDYARVVADSGGGDSHASDAQVPCVITPCSNKIYACGDCLDNDADGLADAADTQCLGPCDNTEDSFFGGIPGQNSAPCKQDCYFDQDTGSGNDDCHWSQQCDPFSVAPDYPPSGESQCVYDEVASIPGSSATCSQLAAQQSATCNAICLPLTPNGCDCFGCCELPATSGKYVWIGSTSGGVGSCDEAHLNDPGACHPCTPVTSCFNDCKVCELCAGRPKPATDCVVGAEPQCSAGQSACGVPGQSACPSEEYCVSGCCVPAPK